MSVSAQITDVHPSDEELAVAAQEGCRGSFSLLVDRYSARLFCFLRQKVGTDQDAEDLVQETFMRSFEKIRLYDPRWRFSTWLYTIAARQAVSHYRKHRDRHVPPPPPPDAAPDPQETLHRREEAHQVWSLARELRPEYYQLLWLRYREDMPIKDMARVLRRTQVQVRVQLHRARNALARQMPVELDDNAPEAAAAARQHVSCG
jgi:RNA polymerase sigma-70 factor (ECF subfamily)